MDLIVANNIGEAGAGFEGDTNIVTLIDRNEKVTRHPRMTKQKVASVLLEEIADKL
jgi:phosphopantothenoylcysteine decarboxylase/phosphopantothenate--cysteine ligase